MQSEPPPDHEANLARPIHIVGLAERAGLSESPCTRLQNVGGNHATPIVERRRIETARQLVDESNHAEIAAETGLGTQSRLTTAFRLAPASPWRRIDVPVGNSE